jgi:flavin reductase (DIM6/NTAB) family NADH-FMN oxidoreductase RutF
MEYIHWTESELQEADRNFRRDFVNRLSGCKTAWLVGTLSESRISNLAVFSQVIHISASPPMIGLLFRPDTVARHSLKNLRMTKQYSLNAVAKTDFQKVHQTSAKYAEGISEFEACAWEEEYREGLSVPLVKEALAQIILEPFEEVNIKSSGGILLIGKILEVAVSSDQVDENGIPLPSQWLSVCGLDQYIAGDSLQTLPYARP